MLSRASGLSSRATRLPLLYAGFLLYVGAVIGARLWTWGAVFSGGEVYFADPDCYARMSRAVLWEKARWQPIRHHDFENWPEGATPHATLPMDAVIGEIAVPLVRTTMPLASPGRVRDVAGAWVGVGLAVLTAAVLWGWWVAGDGGGAWRAGGLALFAASPIAVHGQALGRPDHQALLMLLLVAAFMGEWKLGRGEGCRWRIPTGFAWGLAMWVSLYEPVVCFALAQIARCWAQGRRFFARDRLALALSTAAVAASGWSWEGRLPEWPGGADFAAWAGMIGELRAAGWGTLVGWLGWSTAALAATGLWRRECRAEALIAVALIALTAWQARWGSVAVVGCAGLWLSWPKAVVRGRSARAALGVVAVAGFLPILSAWEVEIGAAPAAREKKLTEDRALRAAAARMAAEPGPFVSAWWHAPALAYWSGCPGVAGSSHSALPGIIRTARVFTAEDPAAIQAALAFGPVRWVAAGNPAELAENGAAVLRIAAPARTAVGDAWMNPMMTPDGWRWEGGVGTVRLFAVPVR